MIEEAIKDIKKPNIDYNFLDPDLLVEGREKYFKDAKKMFKLYNKRTSEILTKNKLEPDEDQKRINFLVLEEEFKKLFLEGLNGSHDEAFKKASAWYEVCYQGTFNFKRIFTPRSAFEKI